MAGAAAQPKTGPPQELTSSHIVAPKQPSAAFYPALALTYFLAAVLSIHLSSEVGNIAAFWTAGAILLTALIRCRAQDWPWLLACAGAADLAANLFMGGTLTQSVGIAVVDVLEPFAIGVGLRKWWDRRPWFYSNWLPLFSAFSIIASLGAATIGSLWLDAVGAASFSAVWLTWATADALGFFVITPFLLSWTDPSLQVATSRRTAVEISGLTALVAAVAIVVFTATLPFLFLLFPLLVLLTLRGGLAGATTGISVLALIGAWITLGGSGPIAEVSSSSSARVLILQLYLFSAVVATFSIALIMSQRRHLADGLFQQTIISRAALDNMAQGLSMFDDEQRLVTCNRRYGDLYRLPPELCVPGTSLREMLEYQIREGILRGAPQDYLEKLNFADRRVMVSELGLSGGQVIAIKRRPLEGGGWVATHEDVTQQRRTSDKILYLARHDSLTGIYNRSYFSERLCDALTRCKSGDLFALHSLDLDRFKEANDTLGHPAGDAILKHVAERLRRLLREGDLVARVGGDEFSILQHGIRGPHEATALADRILEALGRPFDIAGHPVVIGATIGIALSTAGGGDAGELMKKCDLALYRAKGDGRNRYRLFEHGMDALLQARRQLEQELSCALPNGELRLVYQPIVNLETNRICAFEALARWNHPTRGMVAPADFISLAEDKGFIIAIGKWALREACKEAANWPDDVRVAVNLSPVQFKADGLVDAVSAALASSGLRPDRLELEVTESVLLLETKSVLRIFKQLRALGVRLAMDDFGTGYSSLAYLRSFPFDKIKIDQSFVRAIRNDDCLAIVQATVALATKLGITTAAEGVETAQQLAVVHLEGCTEAQGFYISKPLLPAAVRAFLRKQGRRDLKASRRAAAWVRDQAGAA